MSDKIFKIESPDKKWCAEITAGQGANVAKLQYNGNDVLVSSKNLERLQANPYTQGSPMLLPANRTFKGEFEFEGKKYTLPINEPQNNSHLHGLLLFQSFKLLDKTSDEVALYYKNNGEIYPFPFEIKVVYSLKNNSFEQKYYIRNIGTTKMPLTFALHTTFVEPEIFSVPISCCQEKDVHHIPTGRLIALNSQEACYATGSNSKDLVISGYYPSNGNTAIVGDFVYEVSDTFDHWVLFNGRGISNFLCVEPQCGSVNGLNSRNGYRTVLPDETLEFHTKISKKL